MSVLMPRFANPPRFLIDPVAFVVALIGAPLIITIATCFLIVPIFALAMGGPAYLLIGTPLLLVYLRHHDATPIGTAQLALAAIALLSAIAFTYAALIGNQDIIPIILLYGVCGAIFGPFWAALFAILYKNLRRSFYAQPHRLI